MKCYYLVGIILALCLNSLNFYHFGVTGTGFTASLFTCLLILLSLIDWKSQTLPDKLTFALLWMGLLINTQQLFASLETAVFGVVLGYLFLWGISMLFYQCTGKVGMGEGDWKLLAAIGAWIGWQPLPAVIACASLSGLLVTGVRIKIGLCTRESLIPFGPFLAGAGWFFLYILH